MSMIDIINHIAYRDSELGNSVRETVQPAGCTYARRMVYVHAAAALNSGVAFQHPAFPRVESGIFVNTTENAGFD